MGSATVAGVPIYRAEGATAPACSRSHGQGFLVAVALGINERERERERERQPGQEVMYSSVQRIRPLNASESCDHKDFRRPLLPAVRQQRAQKLEGREREAAAAAAGRGGGADAAEIGGKAKMTRALHAWGARIAEVL
jgi:hypothetical protein